MKPNESPSPNVINRTIAQSQVDPAVPETKSKTPTRRKLLYTQKSFLTCRSSSTDSFFLCQILQNIYKDTKQIPIQRCSLISEISDQTDIDENTHFKIDSDDTIDTNTILMEIKDLVHHTDKSISLKNEDIIQTNYRLKKWISSIKSRKRRRTISVDEIIKEPAVISKAKLFKVESNRFLKQNPHITTYQTDPFFHTK